MKPSFFLFTLLLLINTAFSANRVADFYDEFLCEEKQLLSNAGLTTPCGNNPPPPPIPPPNPPPPVFINGLLPVVLVNNSGFPDSQVFVLMTGKVEGTPVQCFLDIDPATGIGTLHPATVTDNGINFSLSFSQLPLSNGGGRVIYLPLIDAGIVWFSLNNKLNMPVVPQGIVQPGFSNPTDPNYNTIFDIFELTYVSTGTNIVADATAVSFFSLPLYGYISTPSSTASNTGLYQPRSMIMQSIANTFSQAPTSSLWQNLFLRNGPQILRVLSTGKAMSTSPTPLFDPSYLQTNAYGFNYLEFVSSFYDNGGSNQLTMQIPNGTFSTYHGTVTNDVFTFTSVPPSPGDPIYTVVFNPLTDADTTFNIFSGISLVATDDSPGAQDGVQISKLFEEAVVTGLIPTTATLTGTFTPNQLYQVNPNLQSPYTGPWYDLYSKALHNLGSIYAFAYDDAIWPDVQIFSNTLLPNTYIGITLGNSL